VTHQIYIKKKKTSFIMAHSNDYLSVIYTGSILLFTLALKGARATYIYMYMYKGDSMMMSHFFFSNPLFFLTL